jgi:predicted RNA-binding protein with PIN domain
MADPTFYLFDGNNLMHAAGVRERQELVDQLASYVSLQGARGVLVFDGHGEEARYGALEVRFASPADHLIERLAAEHRRSDLVCLVSSDQAVRGTSGQEVRHLSSQSFARELARRPAPEPHREPAARSQIGDALDEATRARLERLRRGGR